MEELKKLGLDWQMTETDIGYEFQIYHKGGLVDEGWVTKDEKALQSVINAKIEIADFLKSREPLKR